MSESLRDLSNADTFIQAALEDASVGPTETAETINSYLGYEATSESSVRRWRARMDAEVDKLTSPYPDTDRLAQRPRRSTQVPQWVPGVEHDNEVGELRTVPRETTRTGPVAEPEEAAILTEFGLDPKVWEITGARKSRWQQTEGTWLEAQRVSFRKRGSGFSIRREDVESVLSKYSHPQPVNKEDGDFQGTVMIPAGDLQVGKQDGGGTAATIQRFARLTEAIAESIDPKATGMRGVENLLLPWLGDCIEGIVSQNGRLLASLDVPVSEQVRIYRRLMMHQLGVLAPLARRVLVPVVPGNHDETTRVQQMPITDSWAIEGAVAVQDWMQGRPEYDHVQNMYPEATEPGVTVDVAGLTVSIIHGHTTGRSCDKVIDWWKGQSHGRQLAGQADILISAHWHHLRAEATGGNRTWLQIPALDGGSDWYRRKTGDEPDSGLVTLELTPGISPGWKNLTMWS